MGKRVDAVKLPISKRLLCCAEQILPGARVADVGCDHGYLGIYLLQSGRAEFVHACDLREKPLAKARENAARYGVTENIRFSCADGLSAVDPRSVDTVVCAGMGGDLIAQIIAAAPWLKDRRYTLILQPQSGGNDLRRVLSEIGFGIECEALTEESGFLYYVLRARYGDAVPLSPGRQYCSEPLQSSGSPLLHRYLTRIERALRLTVEGIERSNDPADSERLRYYTEALKEVCEMLGKE